VTLWKKLGTKLKYHATCHPQMDGQIEVTNRTLAVLLRTLIKSNLKSWDQIFTHADHAYNKTPSKTMGMSLSRCFMGLSHFPLLTSPHGLWIPSLAWKQTRVSKKSN